MDVLRNQIIERKTIDLVTSQAEFQDMPFEFPKPDAEAIDHAVCGVAAGAFRRRDGGQTHLRLADRAALRFQ